jgi:hypothetical protein
MAQPNVPVNSEARQQKAPTPSQNSIPTHAIFKQQKVQFPLYCKIITLKCTIKSYPEVVQ